MAILKEIILENGVITNYHRIASVNHITNQSTIIQVVSYPNQQLREKEKNTPLGQKMNIFTESTFINKEYMESYNIVDAYNYLKTLDKYQNGTDI